MTFSLAVKKLPRANGRGEPLPRDKQGLYQPGLDNRWKEMPANYAGLPVARGIEPSLRPRVLWQPEG